MRDSKDHLLKIIATAFYRGYSLYETLPSQATITKSLWSLVASEQAETLKSTTTVRLKKRHSPIPKNSTAEIRAQITRLNDIFDKYKLTEQVKEVLAMYLTNPNTAKKRLATELTAVLKKLNRLKLRVKTDEAGYNHYQRGSVTFHSRRSLILTTREPLTTASINTALSSPPPLKVNMTSKEFSTEVSGTYIIGENSDSDYLRKISVEPAAIEETDSSKRVKAEGVSAIQALVAEFRRKTSSGLFSSPSSEDNNDCFGNEAKRARTIPEPTRSPSTDSCPSLASTSATKAEKDEKAEKDKMEEAANILLAFAKR